MNAYLKTFLWFVGCWLLVGIGCAFIADGLTHDGLTGMEWIQAVIEGPILVLWLLWNILLTVIMGPWQ
jgi:hypothetical protein